MCGEWAAMADVIVRLASEPDPNLERKLAWMKNQIKAAVPMIMTWIFVNFEKSGESEYTNARFVKNKTKKKLYVKNHTALSLLFNAGKRERQNILQLQKKKKYLISLKNGIWEILGPIGSFLADLNETQRDTYTNDSLNILGWENWNPKLQ